MYIHHRIEPLKKVTWISIDIIDKETAGYLLDKGNETLGTQALYNTMKKL